MESKTTIIKRIILIILIIYAIITFYKQQKVLDSYKLQKESIEEQIAEAQDKQKKLNEEKENVNSPEYIEDIARKKLEMYMPNERVYVDNEN